MGRFSEFNTFANQLKKIADEYNYKFSEGCLFLCEGFLAYQKRDLDQLYLKFKTVLNMTNELLGDEIGICFLGFRTAIEVMKNDLTRAHETIDRATDTMKKIKGSIPAYSIGYYTDAFVWRLKNLENSIASNEGKRNFDDRRRLVNVGKKMVGAAKKIHVLITESYRLMGVYYWLIKKQKKPSIDSASQ